MGTESFVKNGQVSRKDHAGRNKGREVLKQMYDPCESVNGAPDYFDRKYMKKYKKQSLVRDMGDEF